MNEVHDVDDSECGYFIFVSFTAISPAVSPCICHPSDSVQLLSIFIVLLVWYTDPSNILHQHYLRLYFYDFLSKAKLQPKPLEGTPTLFNNIFLCILYI